MKWRSSLLLVTIALFLGGFILFYERKRPTSEETESSAKRLFDFKSDEIRWIEIDRDGTLERFEREKSTLPEPRSGSAPSAKREETAGSFGGSSKKWMMVKPAKDKADGFLVDSLADRLSGLESKRALDTPAAAPPEDQAGLSPPRFRIRFDAGKGPVSLLAGREAPATGGVYFRIDKEPASAGGGASRQRARTYLVGRELVGSLDRSPAEWREKQLIDVAALDLGEATVVRPAGTLRFRRQGEDWRLAEPIDDEAQGSKVQGLLSSVTGLRAEAFHETAEVASKAGLQQPAHRVRLARRDGQPAGELLIGNPVEGNSDRLYASAAGREGIAEVHKRILEEIDADAESFRARRLFTISEFEARELKLESKGEKLSLSKVEKPEGGGPGEWKATIPSGLKPKADAVEQTLRSLLEIEADSIVGPARDLPAYGLDPPAARAEVAEAQPSKKEVVRFGKQAPGVGKLYALKEGRSYILTVPSSILDRFTVKTYR